MAGGYKFIAIVLEGATAGAGAGALLGSGVLNCGFPVIGIVPGGVGGGIIGGLIGTAVGIVAAFKDDDSGKKK